MQRLTSLRIVPAESDVEFEAAYPQFMEEIIAVEAGKRLRMITLQSVEYKVNTLPPLAAEREASILIRRRPTGFMQIFVEDGLNVTALNEMLLRIERERNPDRILAERTWYLHSCGRIISNGMSAMPEIPPTTLLLTELRYLIRTILDPREFDPNHAADCLQGVCGVTMSKPCTLHRLRLKKCVALQNSWTRQAHENEMSAEAV